MALLGSSWPLLGAIWSQNGSQNNPNKSESLQKNGPKNDTDFYKNKQNFVPKMDINMFQDGDVGVRVFLDGGFKKALNPKMLPR